ncbi:MAG TPA: hypothetical protein VGD79_06860 [Thermoanaerobaculia bacterium]|jgi:streptogramin lyase
MRTAAVVTTLFLALAALAHPGSAIAVGKDGIVYFVDTGGGVFSLAPDGKVTRREGPAFHWFALDPQGRFRNTPWPSIPGAELRSAGANPTIVLSSDYPAAIGADGKFYYAQGNGNGVQLVGVDASGKRSVRATLPKVPWLHGLAAAPDGSLYYTEGRAIRRVDARGRVSTLVENVAVKDCARVPGEDPPDLRGLAVANDGLVYVTASGCAAVLRVDPDGRYGTVLRASPPWSPTAVAVAGGEVYVLEYLHTASDDRREWIPRVRKVAKSGTVTTIAQPRQR